MCLLNQMHRTSSCTTSHQDYLSRFNPSECSQLNTHCFARFWVCIIDDDCYCGICSDFKQQWTLYIYELYIIQAIWAARVASICIESWNKVEFLVLKASELIVIKPKIKCPASFGSQIQRMRLPLKTTVFSLSVRNVAVSSV